MELVLKYGGQVSAVPFQQIIESWNRDLVQLFLDRGADPVTGAPFARAFKARSKASLGIFLDCKRARPDLADELQQQADMALRQACQEEDLRWVSLLIWLGANPRSKGIATDELDSPDQHNPEYDESALQTACRSQKPEILKRLKPDPTFDDLRELMAAAASIITTPETVAYLVSLGAPVNNKEDGSSTALDTCLRHFGWRQTVCDPSYPYPQTVIPLSGLGKSIEALRFRLNGPRLRTSCDPCVRPRGARRPSSTPFRCRGTRCRAASLRHAYAA
jgi:hypothetical protein